MLRQDICCKYKDTGRLQIKVRIKDATQTLIIRKFYHVNYTLIKKIILIKKETYIAFIDIKPNRLRKKKYVQGQKETLHNDKGVWLWSIAWTIYDVSQQLRESVRISWNVQATKTNSRRNRKIE